MLNPFNSIKELIKTHAGKPREGKLWVADGHLGMGRVLWNDRPATIICSEQNRLYLYGQQILDYNKELKETVISLFRDINIETEIIEVGESGNFSYIVLKFGDYIIPLTRDYEYKFNKNTIPTKDFKPILPDFYTREMRVEIHIQAPDFDAEFREQLR